MNGQEFRQELTSMIRARYSSIYIATFEEERTIRLIIEIGTLLNKKIVFWSNTRGFIIDNRQEEILSVDFRTAIKMAEEMASAPTLFIWCDVHPYFREGADPVYARSFREFSQKIRNNGLPSNSILISPIVEIPVELQKEITIIDLPLPDQDEMAGVIKNFLEQYLNHEGIVIDRSDSTIELLTRAGMGLSQTEMENCLAKALVQNRSITANEVGLILDEKKQIIRKSGILEYISTDSLSLDKVGGLDNLKRWLAMRKEAYTTEAKEYGIHWPKGVLVVGVPGCGKSLCAKCVAASWKMPLIRLDMGKVFSGIIGSSEANLRTALGLCETVSPVILWIDEIEKGLSGVGSGLSDGGTATRLFGYLLTWLQEKKAPVFVFATANNISNIPPELLRKGRFDEIFCVDLPTAAERYEIFKIQIKEINRDPSRFDIDQLVALSGEAKWGKGIRLTGSEIESAVKEGLIESFYCHKKNQDKQRDLETLDIIGAIERMVPLAKVRQSEIETLREWTRENGIPASDQPQI